uniref:Transmembrane protein 220 n=1 Tax=Plectus sambesii TaxID=2011161 RepID=A0A914XCC0_9BILA
MSDKKVKKQQQSHGSQHAAAKTAAEPTHGFIWRFLNAAFASLMVVRSVHHIQTDADWWLWVPAYVLGFLMTASVALSPRCTSCSLWRYTTSLIIVLGTLYLVFNVWVVRDVARGYFPAEDRLEEGKEIAVLAGLLGWAVLNRMKAQSASGGILSAIRTLFLFAVLLACLPIAAYSLCFYSDAEHLPHCKHFL